MIRFVKCFENGTEIKEYCKERNIELDTLGNHEECKIDYQRKGLGQKMYTLMADWLSVNGLKLYKGGTNEMSTSLWENKMVDNPNLNIVEDNGRILIDHIGKDVSYLNIPKNKKSTKNKIR